MRREGWWALLLLGIGGLAAADHVLASYWDFPAASGELPDAARAYRARGLPWVAADITPPPIPRERNAALDLRAAVAALPKGKSTYELEKPGEPSGDLSAFLPALRLARRAAAKPELNFDRDWGQGPSLAFPEQAGVKSLCRILAAHALAAAKSGDDRTARDDLQMERRLATLIGSEPTGLSPLVGAACERMTMAAAQACLVEARGNLSRLRIYRAWLATPAPLSDLNRAMRGEAFMGVAALRNGDRLGVGQRFDPSADFGPGSESTPEWAKYPPSMRRDGFPDGVRPRAYFARYLQVWTELAQTTDGLRDDPVIIGRQADALSKRDERRKGFSYRVTSEMMPLFGVRFAKTNRVVEAHRAVTLAFVDALILHARTGRWPASVAVGDPLGDGPLRARFDGKRFRVWSVGENAKDDRGLLSREVETGPRPDDIVAAYPPVPPLPKESSPPGTPPGSAD